MTQLKLIALDEEDLSVVSSHLQDAVMRVSDMAYLPSQQRFAAIVNRFDWEKAVKTDGEEGYARRRAALHFDRVRGVKLKHLKPGSGTRVLSLLAIGFTATEPPSGYVTLIFSGDTSIRLDVECIELELKDLGLSWKARSKPRHPGGEPGSAGS
jgi:hypothetical protein